MRSIVNATAIPLLVFIELAGLLCLRKSDRKALRQVLKIVGYFALFYVSAYLSTRVVNTWMISEGVLLLVAAVTLLFLYWKAPKDTIESISENLQINKKSIAWVILLVGIVCLTRIGMLRTGQHWDSSEYYMVIARFCREFIFEPGQYVKDLRFLAHPSYGFGFWTTIGGFWIKEDVAGPLIMSLILTAAASVRLYQLFCGYFANMRPWQAFLGTLLCMVNPLFWATFGCLTPDYYMVLFLIFLLAADAKKEPISMFFWGVMAAFTKEIGFVVVAFYFFGKVAYRFLWSRGSIAYRFQNVFKADVWAGIAVGVIIVIYFFGQRFLKPWSHSVYYSDPMSWSGQSPYIYNTFGIQWDNIRIRLEQFFVANFAWIQTGIFILLFLPAIFIKRIKKNLNPEAISQIAWVMIAYGVFMCLYITSGSIRYNAIFNILFTIIVYLLATKVFSAFLCGIGTVFLIALFVVQSFVSIDPVSNELFRLVDVGDTRMLCIAQRSHTNPGGDYYITNLQYPSIHLNFEKMFREIDLQQNDTILIAGQDYEEALANAALSELGGRRMDVRWDPVNRRLVNSIDDNHFLINRLSTNTLWQMNEFPRKEEEFSPDTLEETLNNLSGRIFVYFSPLFQRGNRDILMEQLKQIFELGPIQSVETSGNVLEYCELTLKEKRRVTFPENDLDAGELYSENDLALQQFYLEMISLERDPEDNTREIIREGDRIAVTILCFDENGQFINMGTSPKGVILQTVPVGVGRNIPGFDEAVIGRNIGDTFQISYTFPSVYRSNPTLAGKEITAKVTINSIVKEIPEISDSLVKEQFGYSSVEQMLQSILTNPR